MKEHSRNQMKIIALNQFKNISNKTNKPLVLFRLKVIKILLKLIWDWINKILMKLKMKLVKVN